MITAPKNSQTLDLDPTMGHLLAELSGLDPNRPGDPDGLVARATRPDFSRWLTQAAQARGCTRPVRLRGEVLTIQAGTGVILDRFNTNDLPDQVLYKPCGTRIASLCPACAHTYRWDTYQLIKAGLAGGKGVPESVNTHPAVFVTLTAPSFGTVHSRSTGKDGKPRPCHARRDRPTCPHGKPAHCPYTHHADDSRLGQPLCLDCYDYTGHAVFNRLLAKLWDRTVRHMRRQLGADTGGIVKLRYAKVAEFQRRGVVHLHALLRLDGIDLLDNTAIVPPPFGIDPAGNRVALFTADMLATAFNTAVAETTWRTPGHPEAPDGWLLRWGTHKDAQIIRRGLPGEELTERHVAGYLAKYATKATEVVGITAGRVDAETIQAYTDQRRHTHRLITRCWTLGAADGWDGMRRWAHMLGFGGHFATKSRAYSTTMRELREARRPQNRGLPVDGDDPVLNADDLDDETTLVLQHWTHAGNGWRTTGDAALALQAADAARQRKPAGMTRQFEAALPHPLEQP